MPSILLIEDDEVYREVLATALAGHSHTVVQARDGVEARTSQTRG